MLGEEWTDRGAKKGQIHLSRGSGTHRSMEKRNPGDQNLIKGQKQIKVPQCMFVNPASEAETKRPGQTLA